MFAELRGRQMETTTLSVVGLGLMGSALARALLAAGHATTVWSRSTNKVDNLEKSGACIG